MSVVNFPVDISYSILRGYILKTLQKSGLITPCLKDYIPLSQLVNYITAFCFTATFLQTYSIDGKQLYINLDPNNDKFYRNHNKFGHSNELRQLFDRTMSISNFAYAVFCS